MKLRFVPESLFGRLLMALVATMGVALVVVVALLLRERRELLFARSETVAIVNVISSTAEELAALSPEERSAAIVKLQAAPLAIDSAAARPRQVPLTLEEPARAARAVRERLARALGGAYAVEVAPTVRGDATAIRVGRSLRLQFERSRPRAGGGAGPRFEGPPRSPGPGGFGPPALDVAVTLPDHAVVRFRADVPGAPPPLPKALLLELVFVTVALAAVLYSMARTITRPLAKLAAAAEAMGRGARQQPLPETGARELRDATRAFNAMQERLHRYLDSRTRVLSAMSHDLRTPLTRLKLRTEMLDDERLRERFNADLDEMNRMVQGALDLFKGVNHDEALQEVRIEALVEQIRAEFAELGAQVSVSGSTAAPLAVRRDALKRCLTNLIGNAVKYGARTQVEIGEQGGDVLVRVRDEGPGVPSEMLERVFEPFFRLESSRSADTGGAGLGLSIARDVAQSHGGSLVLRNLAPRGLEAVLTLPRSSSSQLLTAGPGRSA